MRFRIKNFLKRKLIRLTQHKWVAPLRAGCAKFLLFWIYYAVILPSGKLSDAGKLGSPGWNENKISMSDGSAFIMCIPSKMKDERHSLQDEIIRVAATSKTSLKLVYSLMILIDRINPERKSASMRSDVYIMF